MAQVGVKLEMNPEIIGKLSSGKEKLWLAAHEDGSKNRINGEAVAEASSYSFIFGFLAAGGMWIRKKFRNRGKTKEDLAAEKEAAKINRTSGALEEMLLEYIRAAQKGVVEEDSLDELIDTLEEMHGYHQAGKLSVPGRGELAELRKSITEYTAALAESRSAPPVRGMKLSGEDDFCLLREQLIRQKELIR